MMKKWTALLLAMLLSLSILTSCGSGEHTPADRRWRTV